MKKIILSILFTLQLGSGIAQFSDEDLQRRYFLSRDRLKKWFVSASSSPGGGFPIENIILGDGAFSYPFDRVLLKADGTDSIISNDNWNSNSDNAKNTEASGVMSCDNPLIMLGEYLSVLSTEYWLMKHYGMQQTEDFLAVKNEIYYALQAIDRLDGTAERYFDPTLNAIEYNGFLRREDSRFDRLKRVNSYYKVNNGYLHGYIQQV